MFVFLSGILLLMGCTGRYQMVLVTSEPSGADVYLNDKECGKTPVRIKVDKGNIGEDTPVNIVKVEREGYNAATRALTKHFRMHFSCIFWFPIVPLFNDWDVMVYDEQIHFDLKEIPAGEKGSDEKSAKNTK